MQISDSYNEQWSGTWWKVASSTIPYGSKLLSIIVYSDATNCDNLGKTMKHPIYITLGNIPICLRNKPEAKALIAYLPILKATTISEKNSVVFKFTQRMAFMKSLEILFDPIYKQYEDGTILKINKNYIWCILKLSLIISDLPEASAFCTTYKSWNSKSPCHTCLVEKENLNNMNLSSENILLRTPDLMKQGLRDGNDKAYSIHPIKNIFWKFKYEKLSNNLIK